MVIEAFVADCGRDNAGVDAIHGRPDGRGGRDIVLSPITHSEYADRQRLWLKDQAVRKDRREGCSDLSEQIGDH